MAKSKRSNKDSKKGGGNKASGSSNNNNKGQSQPPTTGDDASLPFRNTTTMRYIRLYPIDSHTAMEYVTTLAWIFIVALCLGFSVGIGWIPLLTAPGWRWNVAAALRSSDAYRLLTCQPGAWQAVRFAVSALLAARTRAAQARDLQGNPSHAVAFDILREAVVREKGGYVHADLGWLEPAPSGAARGLGRVQSAYTDCQTHCFPGIATEKMAQTTSSVQNTHTDNVTSSQSSSPPDQEPFYKHQEVLIKVPLSFQMTRQVALDTLLTIIPAQVQKTANLHVLDDAALLVLLLAHERGIGRTSRWLPYIVTLPHQPSCGYHRAIRPQILDMVELLHDEYHVETAGWATELVKAGQYATKIAESLARDYGAFLAPPPPGVSVVENLEWALCHVASRATAGHERHGALRLVPLVDMINHDATAGGFVELKGDERLDKGDFVQALGDHDAGAFVVRSLRNGRRRPLKVGQELLVNYNVPQYAPLDWLVSTGFVPPERWGKWQKVDRVWPPQRWNSVPDHAIPTAEQWSRDAPTILQSMENDNDSPET